MDDQNVWKASRFVTGSERAQFRIQKDKTLLQVEDVDEKEREYMRSEKLTTDGIFGTERVDMESNRAGSNGECATVPTVFCQTPATRVSTLPVTRTCDGSGISWSNGEGRSTLGLMI